MKTFAIKLALLAALVLFLVPCQAQTTNQPPIIQLPDFGASSNWVAAPYLIYDTTDRKIGGGIGLGYRASEFLAPTFRLDAIGGGLFVPSGSLQLQFPLKFRFGGELVPFAYPGIATRLGGQNTGGPVGIFGIGAFLRLPDKGKWYVPSHILADYERWTGAGFNNNQIRFGLGWRL